MKIISFSAASCNIDDKSLAKYRTLPHPNAASGAPSFEHAMRMLIPSGDIFLIDCYPADIGIYGDIIYANTYLRQANFSRALILANKWAAVPIIAGQPLAVASLLHEFVCDDNCIIQSKFSKIVVVIGGYTCPHTLEQFIVGCCRRFTDFISVIHAYGVAEILPAFLLGTRVGSNVIYQPNNIHFDVIEHCDGGTKIVVGDNPQHIVDDIIVQLDGATGKYVVRQPSAKVSTEIFTDLEGWSDEVWARRTGYCAMLDGNLKYQLRQSNTLRVAGDDELLFGQFIDMFGMSWLDKPRWHNRK